MIIYCMKTCCNAIIKHQILNYYDEITWKITKAIL